MTRKVLLSILLIAAVLVAVAGITFAVFSDNISSDDQVFAAGTVDIKVDGYDEFFDTTLDMGNMEPGDCSTQTVTVSNVGSLPVNLWNWIYTWGDSPAPTPNIFACDPNTNCNMTITKTFVAESPLDGREYIVPGGWEDWQLDACLPFCAGNDCQGGTGKMRMFFHAVQQSNMDGYDCVKLEDKFAPTWIPDPTTPAHGNICYKKDGSDLKVVVNGYGLTPGANFQLSLDGGNQWDPDGACTAQDAALAGMPGNLYVSGYWNTGPNLELSCTAGIGEGVWNYAGVTAIDAVTAGATGSISYAGTLSGLPAGTYVVKANVKEVTGALPGTNWTSVLSGLDYLTFTLP